MHNEFTIDPLTLNWYLTARKRMLAGRLNHCPIPEKYFSILERWGYLEGTPERAVMGVKKPPEEWLEDYKKK
jgi:hypothetical protein